MMNSAAPALTGIDHVHVYVVDRAAALEWYRRVLGFDVVAEFAGWQAGGGPLTVADVANTVHIALFQAPAMKNRAVVALRTDAAGFLEWRERLGEMLGTMPRTEDHELSLSIYFADPDGNPYEITTYEVGPARAGVERGR